MTQKIQLQEAFKLALSLMLFYWLALYMDWDMPQFGALAIVVTSLSTSGASLNKGVMRVSGTGLGALAGFVLLFWFSQSPLGMLLAMAVYLIFVGYFMQTSPPVRYLVQCRSDRRRSVVFQLHEDRYGVSFCHHPFPGDRCRCVVVYDRWCLVLATHLGCVTATSGSGIVGRFS